MLGDGRSFGFRPFRGHRDARLLRRGTAQHVVYPRIRWIVRPRFPLWISPGGLAVLVEAIWALVALRRWHHARSQRGFRRVR
jgi:hypothetical protein